jgi:IS30 family transposase
MVGTVRAELGTEQGAVQNVAQEINDGPRKTLGWDTPVERIRDLFIQT